MQVPSISMTRDGPRLSRIAFGCWINDMRNSALPLEQWPAPQCDDATVEGVLRTLDGIRDAGYGVLRGTCELIKPTVERIADFLAAGTAETFYVTREGRPAGKRLKDIELRTKTGATVIAVVRGDDSFTSPGADFRIEAGDTLVLVANHRDMDRAFAYLDTGEADNSDKLSSEGIAPEPPET